MFLSAEEWISNYSTRSKALTSNEFGWCRGSLQVNTSGSMVCPYCKLDTSLFPAREGTDKNSYSVHTKSDVQRGLYLIHVGQINGEGNWLKLGSADKMLKRLFEHMKTSKHEFCDVIYTKIRRGNWKSVEGVEALINGRIRIEIPGRLDEEYFPYSRETANRIRELMDNPQLLVPDLRDEISTQEDERA